MAVALKQAEIAIDREFLDRAKARLARWGEEMRRVGRDDLGYPHETVEQKAIYGRGSGSNVPLSKEARETETLLLTLSKRWQKMIIQYYIKKFTGPVGGPLIGVCVKTWYNYLHEAENNFAEALKSVTKKTTLFN